ncbi:tail fiber protein [Sphingomonas cannabina]|uniref:phage tail protein n=1 Tax=Sphingomonas cannabina TaxID=2899123 RepID=UPI001F1DB727|nr:tail fiber protein [Sphingomonas cannabina]UIJ43801.1 tail fiber protein [Sphingomonas cannabina]
MNDIASALTGSLARDGSGGMQAALPMGGNKITNMAPGTDPSDAATVGQISGATFPVGSVIDFAGDTPPPGWLLCGGQSLSRTDFAALFAVIGTTYGTVSPTTFLLPDCRGRVAAGRDFNNGASTADRLTGATLSPNGTTLGAAGGAQSITLTEAQMPSHTHTLNGTTDSAGQHSHVYTGVMAESQGGLGSLGQYVPSSETTGLAGAHTHTVSGTAASTGGGQAHPNVQPTILFNKIIKA